MSVVGATVQCKGARRAQKGAASPPVDGLEEEKGEAHGGEAAEAAKGGSDCHGGLVLGVPREKISPRRGSAGLGGAQRGDGGAPPRGGALLHRGHPGSLRAVDMKVEIRFNHHHCHIPPKKNAHHTGQNYGRHRQGVLGGGNGDGTRQPRAATLHGCRKVESVLLPLKPVIPTRLACVQCARVLASRPAIKIFNKWIHEE